MNSALWCGGFNFIIPLFKSVPKRYRKRHKKGISAKEMLNGFVEAFQPDLIIETKPGQSKEFGIEFPEKRTGSLEELLERDGQGRCKIGVDLRSVCNDMYNETFRFVQRHPQKVIIPTCTDKKYALLFSAMFGSLPRKGELADVASVYLDAFEGERKAYAAADFPSILAEENIFPLRATRHKVTVYGINLSSDGHFFYMDETSPLDLIEWSARLEMCQWRRETLDKESIWDEVRSISLSRW